MRNCVILPLLPSVPYLSMVLYQNAFNMNGPCEMYHVKPVYNFSLSVELPSCMYHMRCLHNPCKETGLMAVDVIEQRQEKILHQLEMLKAQLQAIRNEMVLDNQKTTNLSVNNKISVQSISPVQVNHLHDIVINVHPKNPPYSLIIIYSLLKEKMKIKANSYIHSSIQELPLHLLNFFEEQEEHSRSYYQILLTLIWKNVDSDLEMIVNPITQSTILGEVNIARYLMALLDLGKSVDPVRATEIDMLLDLSHSSIIHGNNKERQSVLRQLNGILGKSQWLVGNEMSVADIVMWSVLKQTQVTESFPSNLKKWLTLCNNHPAFSLARAICKD